MTPDEKELITTGFKNLNEKIDLMIHPVKQDVTDIKITVGNHADKINVLELFKEGHQQHHISEYENRKHKTESSRFNWEIIVGFVAGSGVVSAVLYKIMGV